MASGDASRERIRVEVAYALPRRQALIELEVEKGCTALEAARRSRITERFPELDLENADMGIFSKRLDGKAMPAPQDYVLEEWDRVEIYRPLLLDPKEARLLRARKSEDKEGRAARGNRGES